VMQSNGNGEYRTFENGQSVEWWKSKKFTGYMVGDFTWKGTIFVCLYILSTTNGGEMSPAWLTFMFTIVVTAGVAQMGFLGGQAWIDRYTKAIQAPVALGSAVMGTIGDVLDDKDEEKEKDPAPDPEEEAGPADPEEEPDDEK